MASHACSAGTRPSCSAGRPGNGHAGSERTADDVRGGLRGQRLGQRGPYPVAVAPPSAATDVWSVEHIAVGYDASDEAEMALGTAAGLARALGADVRVIAVADPPPGAVPAVVQADLEELLRHARHAVETLDVAASAELAEGPAAPTLVRESADGVDLLVVGSRSRGPLEAVETGSVSGHVVEHARCPVLVVPRSVAARQPA